MRVLVAGATGVIGRALVPLLASAGHEVLGLARPPGTDPAATWVTADALDRTSVLRAVRNAAPDAVVHVLTALPGAVDPRRMGRDLGPTNRLRTEGTAALLAAAEIAGVGKVISQGLAYAYDPAGEGLADEDTPLWRRPPKQFRSPLHALEDLERQTAQAGGLVLRFGHLYGPGSIYAPDGTFVAAVRAGKVPVVGHGTATFSFTHAHDAATAVVAALDKDATGVLNIVDDDPAPVSVWLPALAEVLRAPHPGHVPAALARIAVGGWGVAYMTRLRGADNTRARLQLNWRPRFLSWRDGFHAELAAAPPMARPTQDPR